MTVKKQLIWYEQPTQFHVKISRSWIFLSIALNAPAEIHIVPLSRLPTCLSRADKTSIALLMPMHSSTPFVHNTIIQLMIYRMPMYIRIFSSFVVEAKYAKRIYQQPTWKWSKRFPTILREYSYIIELCCGLKLSSGLEGQNLSIIVAKW